MTHNESHFFLQGSRKGPTILHKGPTSNCSVLSDFQNYLQILLWKLIESLQEMCELIVGFKRSRTMHCQTQTIAYQIRKESLSFQDPTRVLGCLQA